MQPVEVLISTYNGRPFLQALLDSVLAQDYGDVRVLIRDDGSTDGTVELLQQYAAHSNITMRCEKNIGAAQSFLRLLTLSGPHVGYVAFADQDDVWERTKLSRAVAALAAQRDDQPLMYCGRTKVVDAALRPLGLSQLPRRGPAFGNALVQNIASGCTVVLNARARELLLQGMPSVIIMHDWWAYLVITAFGSVIYDPQPHVLYRQHARNVMGAQFGPVRSFRTRLRRFREHADLLPIRAQAREFRRIYGSTLNDRDREIIERFLQSRTLAERIRYALSPDVWRQSRVDDAIMRVLLAVGRL